jgi:hypothetical protein
MSSTVEKLISAPHTRDQQQLNLGPTQKCGCMYMLATGAGDFDIDVEITFDVNWSFHQS